MNIKRMLVCLLQKISMLSHKVDSKIARICYKLVCKLQPNEMIIFRDFNIEEDF